MREAVEMLREWVHRASSSWRRNSNENLVERELETHLEMAEEALRRQGYSDEEAARLARLRFDTVPRALDALYEQRGLPWLGRFSLDITLGIRRLRRFWGITAIGGLAMSVAIGIAAAGFSFVRALSGEAVPLEEGDRVVAVQTWNETLGRAQSTTPEDLERWRTELRAVVDVGAFRTARSNLALSDDDSVSSFEQDVAIVSVAEMSASGFRLARVPPMRGRPLIEADERPDSEPVLVIGYDVWRTRFGEDSDVIGRRVRLDGTVHTVVGVMPEDFSFPINHQYWIPLRVRSPDRAWDEGPEITAFGRLAPGISIESAQAELRTLGLVPRATVETVPSRLYARIRPYAQAFVYLTDGGLILLLLSILLIPPCANIAILVYARTVVRQEEFAIRAVLGASRARIVIQLFLEMLLLSVAAACVALVSVHFALARLQLFGESGANPFWMDLGVSPGSALYIGALALLAGAIAGVVPAMQATGGLMQSGLRERTGGVRLGKLWSAMVIVQIMLAVLFLPLAVNLGWGMLRPGVLGPGFLSEEYLTARVQFFGPIARFVELQQEFIRRLEGEAGIRAVAVSQLVPGTEPSRQAFELEQGESTDVVDDGSELLLSVSAAANRVGRSFFETFELPVLAGRAFQAGDFAPGRNSILVNGTFAQRFAVGQGSLLGRRVRERARRGEPEGWYEIVGVVADLPAHDDAPRLYLPMTPGQTHPLMVTIRINPGVEGAAGTLRALAISLDPGLLVDEVDTFDGRYRRAQSERTASAYVLAIVTLSVVLLSAAGMYALMSFTVNQRRREIGLRSALGAQPLQLIAGTFRKPIRQIAAGAALGLLAAYAASILIPIEDVGGRRVPGVLLVAALFILVVGVLAVIGPASRALRLTPTEALRTD